MSKAVTAARSSQGEGDGRPASPHEPAEGDPSESQVRESDFDAEKHDADDHFPANPAVQAIATWTVLFALARWTLDRQPDGGFIARRRGFYVELTVVTAIEALTRRVGVCS